ncbi:MAG: GFA family protein [Paracoccaceae bacterium]|nr:GFA family protein [Paracoccaceae bacterium]
MTETPNPLSGRCMCGAVTVTMTPAKPEIHACHCDMCRRWTGSVYLEIDAVPGSVKAEGPVKTFKSSDWAERANCGQCGSPLWFHLTAPGGNLHAVSAGLFDDAGGFPLAKEIYIDRKPNGFSFVGDHVRLTEEEFETVFTYPKDGGVQ